MSSWWKDTAVNYSLGGPKLIISMENHYKSDFSGSGVYDSS